MWGSCTPGQHGLLSGGGHWGSMARPRVEKTGGVRRAWRFWQEWQGGECPMAVDGRGSRGWGMSSIWGLRDGWSSSRTTGHGDNGAWGRGRPGVLEGPRAADNGDGGYQDGGVPGKRV